MKTTHQLPILIAGFCMIMGCSTKHTESQETARNEDSIKSLILSKETATLDRWYSGDPMGFIDNSWDDVTYFDPSLSLRIDSIDAFRKLLEPIVGLVHVPSHTMKNTQIKIIGDVALLTFTDVFAFGEDTARWHATEIYQYKNDDWKLIHSHWTESKVK